MFVLITLLGSLVSAATAPEFRVWQDIKGKFRIEAQFVSLEDSKVQLKKRDGSVILVPLEKLSKADQEYALGQTRPSNANGSFPRAVKELPDWLLADCPFDVQQFWIKVPPDKNAAELYLDALYDFAPELEAYFPPEVQSARTPATKKRAERSSQLQVAWNAEPQSKKHRAERDAVLQEHLSAFNKLAEAQKRPNCVFEIGSDVPSHEPLLLACREVIRVAVLQVERDVERGDFAAALRMIQLTLRLSRDLRPRSPISMQLAADALDNVIVDDLLRRTLKAPALTIPQCDALLRVLVQHATAVRSMNPYVTAVRWDYLSKRMLLHDLQEQIGEFSETRYREAFGIPHETRATVLYTAVNGTKKVSAPELAPPGTALLNAVVTGMKPANYEAEVAMLKEQCEAYSAAVNQPSAARTKTLSPLTAKEMKVMSQMAEYFPPPNTPPEQAIAHVQTAFARKPLQEPILALLLRTNSLAALVHPADSPEVLPATRLEGAKALVALRRWYGTHSNPPPDMATLCRAAKLTEVPRDYFSDGPLRIVTFAADTPIQDRLQRDLKAVAGETIIYSVGSDHVDDRASKDWAYSGPGDFLFRLEIPQTAVKVTR